MVRFNTLKIFINANEAKPGGNIGAMLSPYLFSVNMTDFCKRFNEQSKDFVNAVYIPVYLYTDNVDKTYTFFLKNLAIGMFLIYYLTSNNKISLLFLYDLVIYYANLYKLSLYRSTLIIFSSLKSFSKRVSVITFANLFYKKYV